MHRSWSVTWWHSTTCESWEHPTSLVWLAPVSSSNLILTSRKTLQHCDSGQKIGIICKNFFFFSPSSLTPPPQVTEQQARRIVVTSSWCMLPFCPCILPSVQCEHCKRMLFVCGSVTPIQIKKPCKAPFGILVAIWLGLGFPAKIVTQPKNSIWEQNPTKFMFSNPLATFS